MATLELKIVTPEGPVYQGTVNSVVLPGSEGQFGVLPEHVRFLAPLKIGEAVISPSDGSDFYAAISGGFTNIDDDKVTVLAEKIIDAVIVPIHVVANRQNEKVVYVATGSGSEKRVVETGAFNDTFVEIKTGLEPDEKVLLNPPLFAAGVSSNDAFKDQDATGPAPPKQRRGGQGPAGMNRPGAPGGGTPNAAPGQRGGRGGGQMPAGMAERMKNLNPEQRKAIAEAMKKRSGNAGGAPGQKRPNRESPSSPPAGAPASK